MQFCQYRLSISRRCRKIRIVETADDEERAIRVFISLNLIESPAWNTYLERM
jgi:hypothetical protein